MQNKLGISYLQTLGIGLSLNPSQPQLARRKPPLFTQFGNLAA